MDTSIEHIGLCAQDPLALARWYVDVLGFRVVHEVPDSRVAFVRAPGGGMLEIFPAAEQGNPEAKFHPGLRHLAFAVEDCASAVQELRARGVHLPDEEIIQNPAHVVAFFRDPEGNLIHLVERHWPLGTTGPGLKG